MTHRVAKLMVVIALLSASDLFQTGDHPWSVYTTDTDGANLSAAQLGVSRALNRDDAGIIQQFGLAFCRIGNKIQRLRMHVGSETAAK